MLFGAISRHLMLLCLLQRKVTTHIKKKFQYSPYLRMLRRVLIGSHNWINDAKRQFQKLISSNFDKEHSGLTYGNGKYDYILRF